MINKSFSYKYKIPYSSNSFTFILLNQKIIYDYLNKTVLK